MSSGGGTTTSTQQAQSSPWTPIQPYLTDVAQQAQNLSQSQQGNNQLPSSVAPLSATTQQGMGMVGQAGAGGAPLVGAAQGSLQGLINGSAPGMGTLQSLTHGYNNPGNATAAHFADPNSINPYLHDQFAAASKPVIDQVNATMGLAGRTGSGADQQLLTRNLGDMASQMYGNAYDSAANRSLSAAGQMSGNALNQANIMGNAANTMNSQTLNAANAGAGQGWQSLQNLLSVGGMQDQQNNSVLQDQLQQYMYGQQQPWNLLNAYSGDVTGLGALGQQSSGSSSSTAPKQSMIPGLIGSAIQAAPMAAMTLPFSDVRLKESIRRIGTADNGLPLYIFRYKGADQFHVGPMAQDVEKIKPDAVVHDPSGFMRVDYQRALAA